MQVVTAIRHNPNENLNFHAVVRDTVVLKHDERHLRRKALTLLSGKKILLDLIETVALVDGDELLLEDGSVVKVSAAVEPLLVVQSSYPAHLIELAWHIGNRHLSAAIFTDHFLILNDHVIKSMLEGLGATVHEISAPFNPVRGAYASHGDKETSIHRHE
ncbi:urease accessory protein UreE [Brucella sp. HL-2]|nr:urease accessory protein UreE [Brucella sp. HL-2]MCV9909727.1 urease accessory protein UreE [Brucella sp. HL-2]